MKIAFAGSFAFINLKFGFLPNLTLLTLLAVVMVLDFLTGVYKAKVKGEVRTSNGYRRTINKFIQYAAAIVCASVLSWIGSQKGGAGTVAITGFLNDGLLIFITYIEITSIFENLYEVDKETMMSKYFYAPMLKILTFQIKNNPIVKQAEQIKDGPKDGSAAH